MVWLGRGGVPVLIGCMLDRSITCLSQRSHRETDNHAHLLSQLQPDETKVPEVKPSKEHANSTHCRRDKVGCKDSNANHCTIVLPDYASPFNFCKWIANRKFGALTWRKVAVVLLPIKMHGHVHRLQSKNVRSTKGHLKILLFWNTFGKIFARLRRGFKRMRWT